MFKKFVTYLTLISFINSQFLPVVLACETLEISRIPSKFQQQETFSKSHREVFKNDKGEFVIDGGTLFLAPFEQVELLHKGTVVGELNNQGGHIDFRGFNHHNFYLSNLPSFNSLTMNLGGAVTTDSLLHARDYIDIVLAGHAVLNQGFRVESQNGFVSLANGTYELGAQSLTKVLKVSNLKGLKINKDARLESDLMVSEDVLKSLQVLGNMRLGMAVLNIDTLTGRGKIDIGEGRVQARKVDNYREFNTDTMTLAAEILTNTGTIRFGQAAWEVTSTTNSGLVDIVKALMVKGAWHNTGEGRLKVGEHFQGSFTTYNDDGDTQVQGLAMVNAENGRITGNFQAQNGIVNFQDDLTIPESANFSIQDHFTMHSDHNLQFNGNLFLKFRSDWPAIELSAEVLEQIRSFTPGAFLSATGDLTKGGNITSSNSSIHCSAGGKYEGKGGIVRSGFFEGNNTSISASAAKLADKMQSFNDLTLRAKVAELMGSRQIDGLFDLDVKDLIQHQGDQTKAGMVSGRAENVTLAGKIELARFLALKVVNLFKTEKENEIKGGTVDVNTRRAELDGKVKDGHQQVVAKEDIILGKTFEADVASSHLQGEKIQHQPDSKLVVSETSTEIADKLIETQEGSLVKAATNNLVTQDRISIAGEVESTEKTYLKGKTATVEKTGRIKTKPIEKPEEDESTAEKSKEEAKPKSVKPEEAKTEKVIQGGKTEVDVEDAFYNLGTLSARDHLLRGGNMVYNSGYLDSDESLKVDTKYHFNVFGGQEYAKHAEIYADRANVNFMADFSATTGEINTVVNMNVLGRMRGSSSLKINALLANVAGPGGVFQSNNYTANSPLNLTYYGGTIRDLPEFSSLLGTGEKKGVDYFLGVAGTALSVGNLVCKGAASNVIMGGQLLLGGIGVARSAYTLYNMDNKGDEGNEYRLSRIAKKGGEVLGLGMSAFQTFQGAKNLVSAKQKTQPQPEKPILLWDLKKECRTKDALMSFMGGNTTANSIFSYDGGYNATGSVTRRNLWDYDSSTTVAFTTNVSTRTGSDLGTKYTFRSTALASGDYTIGGDKYVFSDYTVQAGGNVVVENNANLNAASSTVAAEGTMLVKEGATATGERAAFQSTGNMDFAGKSNGTDEASVKSSQGSAIVRSGAEVNSEKSATVTAATTATSEAGSKIEGAVAALVGQTGTTQGGEVVGERIAVGTKASATVVTEKGVLRHVAPEPAPEAKKDSQSAEPTQPQREMTQLATSAPKELTDPISVLGKTVEFRGKLESKTPGVNVLIDAEELAHITATATSELAGKLTIKGAESHFEAKDSFKVGALDNHASKVNTFNGKVNAVGDVKNTSGGTMDFGANAVANGQNVLTQGQGKTTVSGTMNAQEKAQAQSLTEDITLQNGGAVKGGTLASVTGATTATSEAGSKIEGAVTALVGQTGTTQGGEVAGERIAVGTKASATVVTETGVLRHVAPEPTPEAKQDSQSPVPTQETPPTSPEGTDKTEPQEHSEALEVKGKTIDFKGKVIGGTKGVNVLLDAEELAQVLGTAQVNMPGTLFVEGASTAVEKGANLIVESYSQHSAGSTKFAGNVEAEKTIRVIADKGHTDVTADSTIKIKREGYVPPVTHAPVAKDESADNPTPKVIDEAVTIAGGSASVGGNIDTPTGVACHATDGSLLLREDLKVKADGDVYGTATEYLTKEKGSDIAGRNIHYNSDKGTRVNGVSTATVNFSAASNGSVVEESGSRTTVGEEVSFNAGKDMITQQGAEASGKRVFREGETNDFAGVTRATELSSVKARSGSLHIHACADNQAPHHQLHTEGQFFLDPGANIKGNSCSMKGLAIADLPDLMTQTNRYRNFGITDYMFVETNQHVHFNTSQTSASKGFELHTDQITVGPNVNLMAASQLGLYSMKENFTVGAGSTLGAGVFTDIYSGKEVIWQHEKNLTYGTNRYNRGMVTDVAFKGVNFIGGTGVEYEYTDPSTGEKSMRKMGLRIRSEGQAHGVGGNFGAGSDIVIDAGLGFINEGDSQLYVSRQKVNKNKWRTKVKTHFDTEFFTGAISTPGKIVASSENGGFMQRAGIFVAGQGADIITSGSVSLLDMKGKSGHTTVRANKWNPVFDTYDKKTKGLNNTTTFVNQGDSTVRIWSTNGDVNAPGLRYVGAKGDLSMMGHNLYLDRRKLNNSSSSISTKVSYDYSLLTQWKSLNALQASKDLVHDLNQGDYIEGVAHAADPSLTIGIDRVFSDRQWQTLGPGSILTNGLTLDFTNDIHQRNGYGITALGDAHISAERYFQTGAKLKGSSNTTSVGIYGSANSQDATAGVRFSQSKTETTRWVPAVTNVNGTLYINVGKLNQDAGILNAGKASGHIGEVKSRTRQDTSKTTSMGFSIDYKGSFSGYFSKKKSREATHTAGLFIDEAGEDFSIGSAHLRGAKIYLKSDNGANIGPVHSKGLPEEYRNRGYTVGYSGNFEKMGSDTQYYGTATVGVSNNGHEVSASIALKNPDAPKDPKAPLQLFDFVGTATYRNTDKGINITTPIVTGVNPEAWDEFGKDAGELGVKIADGASKTMDTVKEFAHDVAEVSGKVVDKIVDGARDVWDALTPTPQPVTSEVVASTPVPYQPMVGPFPSPVPGSFAYSGFGDVTFQNTPHRTESLLSEHPTSANQNGDSARGSGSSQPQVPQAPTSPFDQSPFIMGGGSALLAGMVPMLNSMGTPLNVGGASFSHIISGTKIYVQDPSLLSTVQNTYKSLSDHPSVYAQRGRVALNDPRLSAFFYNSGHTPKGVLGSHVPLGNNGQKGILIAGLSNHPNYPVHSVLGHEAYHWYLDLMSGGQSLIPGFVPGNPGQTYQNMGLLLNSFSQDMQARGITSSSFQPRSVEEHIMFHETWGYFHRNLNASGLPSPLAMSAENAILKGSPLCTNIINFQNSGLINKGNRGQYVATMQAEMELASEIPALLTNTELLRLENAGIGKTLCPRTVEALEYFETQTPNGSRGPLNKSTLWEFGSSGPSTGHDLVGGKSFVLPQGSNAYTIGTGNALIPESYPVIYSNSGAGNALVLRTYPLRYSNYGNLSSGTGNALIPQYKGPFSNPHVEVLSSTGPKSLGYKSPITIDMKVNPISGVWEQAPVGSSGWKTGLKALPLVGFGIDAAVQHWGHGHDFPDSFAKATINTGVGAVVYGGVTTGIAMAASLPVALTVTGLDFAAGFIPDYSDRKIINKLEERQRAIDEHDANQYLISTIEARNMIEGRALKTVLTVPSQLFRLGVEKFNDTFPTVEPRVSAYFDSVGADVKNDTNAVLNGTRMIIGMDPIYTVKTDAELKQENDAFLTQKLRDVEVKLYLQEVDKRSAQTQQQIETLMNAYK